MGLLALPAELSASLDSQDLVLLQQVLQRLLAEEVTLHRLETILDTFQEARKVTLHPVWLTELVRVALGWTMCRGRLDSGGELNVVQLSPLGPSAREAAGKAPLIREIAARLTVLERVKLSPVRDPGGAHDQRFGRGDGSGLGFAFRLVT